MGAKALVSTVNDTQRSAITDSRKPASAAVIMDSMVATEAELRAVWADMEQTAGIGVVAPAARLR